MPTKQEYIERISRFDWDGLLGLWDEICDGSTDAWPPGKALEYLVLRAFQLDGAEVQWPFEVRIGEEIVEQIDGAVHTDGFSCLIECKDTVEPMGVAPIAKMRNQLLRRPGNVLGLLFSRNGFTESATILAQFLAPQTILLWHGRELEFVLQRRAIRAALVRKYRYCVEQGFADFNIVDAEVMP
jgi:hypothetical protein